MCTQQISNVLGDRYTGSGSTLAQIDAPKRIRRRTDGQVDYSLTTG